MKNWNRFVMLFKIFVALFLGTLCYKEKEFVQTFWEILHFEDRFYDIKSIEQNKNHKIAPNIHHRSIDYVMVKEKPKHWVSLPSISKNVKGAIIVSEDGLFFRHRGFDPISLRDRVYETFVLKKKKLKGGSTITQQLVKNLYLSNEKTLGRKGKELLLSIFLESVASKEKILETYLNVIEYGENLYGIGNASRKYFKKSPKYLTPREGAFLAMLLPSPIRYSRSFKNKMLTRYARRQVGKILYRMKQNQWIHGQELIQGLTSSMSFETMKNESFDYQFDPYSDASQSSGSFNL